MKVEPINWYFDNPKAIRLYPAIFGGENIHTGIYKKKSDSIDTAAENTMKLMTRLLPKIGKNTHILNLGTSYGAAARFLAQKYQCKIECLSFSEQGNEYNEQLTKEAELEDHINIQIGNYEQLPFAREAFDIVWSQDAFFHNKQREKVFREVARVLKPEGRFIFTEVLKSQDCPEAVLKDIEAVVPVGHLFSIREYRRIARKADLEQVFVREMPEQLIKHYSKVIDAAKDQLKKLSEKADKDLLQNMIDTWGLYVENGEKGYLNWGILQFQKRNI
jgi:cyclopropane fatty-acyl-phospholipid synthase-like methyltransferase